MFVVFSILIILQKTSNKGTVHKYATVASNYNEHSC